MPTIRVVGLRQIRRSCEGCNTSARLRAVTHCSVQCGRDLIEERAEDVAAVDDQLFEVERQRIVQDRGHRRVDEMQRLELRAVRWRQAGEPAVRRESLPSQVDERIGRRTRMPCACNLRSRGAAASRTSRWPSKTQSTSSRIVSSRRRSPAIERMSVASAWAGQLMLCRTRLSSERADPGLSGHAQGSEKPLIDSERKLGQASSKMRCPVVARGSWLGTWRTCRVRRAKIARTYKVLAGRQLDRRHSLRVQPIGLARKTAERQGVGVGTQRQQRRNGVRQVVDTVRQTVDGRAPAVGGASRRRRRLTAIVELERADEPTEIRLGDERAMELPHSGVRPQPHMSIERRSRRRVQVARQDGRRFAGQDTLGQLVRKLRQARHGPETTRSTGPRHSEMNEQCREQCSIGGVRPRRATQPAAINQGSMTKRE